MGRPAELLPAGATQTGCLLTDCSEGAGTLMVAQRLAVAD